MLANCSKKKIFYGKVGNTDFFNRKRTKKANEDVVSNVLTREIKKRSSSLPEARAAPLSGSALGSSSGVELLTDQLVSNIMVEVTGSGKKIVTCTDFT